MLPPVPSRTQRHASPPIEQPEELPEPVLEPPVNIFTTEPNEFGLFREYPHKPSFEPDTNITINSLCDDPTLAQASKETRSWWSGLGKAFGKAANSLHAPFRNPTVFRLVHWFYGTSTSKSITDLDALMNNVILADGFHPSHLDKFNAASKLNKLNHHLESVGLSAADGWKETSVELCLPATHVKHASEESAPKFKVKNVFYQSLIEVIKSAFQDPTANFFHYMPFKLFWKPSPDQPFQRIISELYNSEAMITEHKNIQKQPVKEGCTLERSIAAIMLWSDATHLANFGTASLWPIYLFFSNQSKYTRGKPTSCASHHIAYLPSVSAFHEKLFGC
jgi:Plavaka transposase